MVADCECLQLIQALEKDLKSLQTMEESADLQLAPQRVLSVLQLAIDEVCPRVCASRVIWILSFQRPSLFLWRARGRVRFPRSFVFLSLCAPFHDDP